MKYSKFLLLCIAVLPMCAWASELPSLQQSAINKKAIAIEKEMTRDRYATYGLNALRFAYYIYPWIALYQKGLDFSKRDASEKDAAEETISRLQKIKAFFNHLFYTQEGWTAIAQAGIGGASSVITSRICDKFIHPDTLYWYMHSYAPYRLTTSLMKKRQLTDSKTFLYILYKRLVRQVESICAYQMYKYKRLNDEEKEIAKHAIHAMFTVQQDWLQRIAIALKVEVIDFQLLHTLLSEYEEVIHMHITHFALIEGETLEDRYIVKQQIRSLRE